MKGLGGFATGSGAPRATVGIIVALSVAFVAAWLGLSATLTALLAFVPEATLAQPWTLLTYPLASAGDGGGLIWFFLLCWWLFMNGQLLEPELGAGRYLLAFAAFTLIGALAMLLCGVAFGVRISLAGAWLPVAALTVLWGIRARDQQVLFLFVLPIKAKWLAVLTALLVLFGYGTGAPIAGVFALLPLAAAWLYGDNRLPFLPYGRTAPKRRESNRKRQEFNRFVDDVRTREKQREERERLRKLFESSIQDDDEK